MKLCIGCGSPLTAENWYKSCIAKCVYRCKVCIANKARAKESYRNARTTKTKKKIYDKVLSLKITNVMMGARKRGIDFQLTYAEAGVLMQEACTYCGSHEAYVGLDRINSDLEYSSDNVAPCCSKCNWAKNSASVESFINHCRKIVLFQGATS